MGGGGGWRKGGAGANKNGMVLMKRKFEPGNISGITYRFCLVYNSLIILFHYFTKDFC